MKKMYLVLENGRSFEGEGFGYTAQTVGELVFSTSVCGYVEALTDAAYCGQILMSTFPLSGNYGVAEEDFAGKCLIKGYVARELCDVPSNFRSQYDLNTFLINNRIPAICGVDTREITRILRTEGTMNAGIFEEIPEDLSVLKGYKVSGAQAAASVTAPCVFTAESEKHRVTVIDNGCSFPLVTELNKRGCTVTLVPYNYTAEQLMLTKPDGIIVSDGGGSPYDCTDTVNTLKSLFGKLPILGIGLGHQLTALAAGGKCTKLLHGHRGGNNPVRALGTARTYITAQNHGWVVEADSVSGATQTFININDNSCEGLKYTLARALTLQFLPDTSGGVQDLSRVYDEYVALLGGNE